MEPDGGIMEWRDQRPRKNSKMEIGGEGNLFSVFSVRSFAGDLAIRIV
jgi:hypothetical protein